MQELRFTVGLLAGVAFSCVADTRKDDAYQDRIDAHCTKHCRMNLRCIPRSESEFESYEDCFSTCSDGEWWWKGDETCKQSRWAFADCTTTVTDCEVWSMPTEPPNPCEDLWEPSVADCQRS